MDDLAEHEGIAAGLVLLVIDLRRAQKPAQLERAQQVRDVIGADLPSLADHHPVAARMIVPVPAAAKIGGRIDDPQPAADVDAFDARLVDGAGSVFALVGEIAHPIVSAQQRIVRFEPAEFASRQEGIHLLAERAVEVLPAATRIADDGAPVQDVSRQMLEHILAQMERGVTGKQHGGHFAGIVREMGKVAFDGPVADAELLVQPSQKAVDVGRVGHPIAVGDPLAVDRLKPGLAERHLGNQRRRGRRPLPLGSPQRSDRQRQRGEALPRLTPMRLCLLGRAAIDWTGICGDRLFAVTQKTAEPG